ncbi:hypothetical protein D3C81_1405320 [compost metagenome]
MVLGNGRPLSYTASSSSRCSSLPRGTPLASRMNSSIISISGLAARNVRACSMGANCMVLSLAPSGAQDCLAGQAAVFDKEGRPEAGRTVQCRARRASGGRAWRQCHKAQKARMMCTSGFSPQHARTFGNEGRSSGRGKPGDEVMPGYSHAGEGSLNQPLYNFR